MADFRDKVEFKNISKVYPVDAHVECKYILKPAHKASSYDWIGLFRVGWSTNKDVIFYHWAPVPKARLEGEETDGSVMFHATNLPSEDGEFYQFVYFNDRNKMCGASTPFQFRVPRNDDIIEQDMEDDEMVLITTNTLVLEEKLRNLELEKEKLQQNFNGIDSLRASMSQQLQQAELQIANLTLQKETQDLALAKSSQTIEELKTEHTQALEAAKAEVQAKTEELETCETQLSSLREELSRKQEECVQVKNELDLCIGQSEALKKELELVKNYCTRAEDERQQAFNELEEAKTKLVENTGERETIDTLQALVNSSQETIEGLEKHVTQQKNVIEASTAKQVVLEEEISTLKETLGNMSARIEQVNTENHDVKSKLSKDSDKYEAEIAEWKQTVSELSLEKNSFLSTIARLDRELKQAQEKADNTDEFDAQEDRYVALQTAYSILKDELARCEADLSKLKRKEAKFKQSSHQIAELQAKLKIGEEEWKKVYQEKVEAERKLQRSTSRSSITEEKIFNTSLTASLSGSSGGDLTKEELQKITEQLTKELELRTQKKDKYKQKYLDEKQKVATLKEDHNREVEKLRKDLELARAQLDTQIMVRSAGSGVDEVIPPQSPVRSDLKVVVYPAVPGRDIRHEVRITYPGSSGEEMTTSQSPDSTEVKPIVYPPVPDLDAMNEDGGARPKMEGPRISPRQKSNDSDKLSKGALEESITEDLGERRQPLTPLPAPIQPTRAAVPTSSMEPDFKNALRSNLGLTEHPESSPSVAPAGRSRHLGAKKPRQAAPEREEVTVITREDSDDDNDAADRFHDASSDVPMSMVKCFMCDKVFHSEDSAEDRNAHVNEHLAGEQETDRSYSCPMCNKEFSRDNWSKELVEMHVNSHFTISDE